MKITRAQLITGLEHEMATNTQWLRIHAAEGLLDNGESKAKISELFRTEAATAVAPYRIGVWRVLARATDGEERNQYIAKIRTVLGEPEAIDRISAAESLGKLNAATREDRAVIFDWLKTASDASAPFPRWLLVLSSTGAERATDEAALAQFVNSPDAIARIRAAFALGRLKDLSAASIAKIREQLQIEPADSIARIYLITALLLHVNEPMEVKKLEAQLVPYLHGKANEQLELGIVTGLRGKEDGIEFLKPLLNSSEPDARIGAANGTLKLLR